MENHPPRKHIIFSNSIQVLGQREEMKMETKPSKNLQEATLLILDAIKTKKINTSDTIRLLSMSHLITEISFSLEKLGE